MFRETMTTLLVSALLLGGCTKKDKADAPDKTTEKASGKSASKAASSSTAAEGERKAVSWEKVERVPFAKLQSLMPDPALGMKRSNLAGQTVPDGERTYSEATATFEGANEQSLTITIQDHPMLAQDDLASKTTAFKGYPVVEEREDSNEAGFTILVGDRFIVHARGDKVTAAQLKSVVEKLDLAKLASWKLEGIN